MALRDRPIYMAPDPCDSCDGTVIRIRCPKPVKKEPLNIDVPGDPGLMVIFGGVLTVTTRPGGQPGAGFGPSDPGGPGGGTGTLQPFDPGTTPGGTGTLQPFDPGTTPGGTGTLQPFDPGTTPGGGGTLQPFDPGTTPGGTGTLQPFDPGGPVPGGPGTFQPFDPGTPGGGGTGPTFGGHGGGGVDIGNNEGTIIGPN